MGEYQLSILIDYVDLDKQAAVGWDGDRYEVYVAPNGQLAIAWVSTWDSPKDAEEFATVYQKYLKRMKRLQSNDKNDGDKSTSKDQPGVNHEHRWDAVVHQTDSDVTIIQGLDTEQANRILKEMKPVTKTEKHFPKREKPKLEKKEGS